MANQKITVVYQDCVLCGDRGKAIGKIVAEKGIRLHKVSFASDEGRALVRQAVFENGIKTMPFYYDGKRFASTLAEIIAKPVKHVEIPAEIVENSVEKPKKSTKRGKRTKKASK